VSFLIPAQSDAEKILQRLDPRFVPRLTLVSFPTETSKEKKIGVTGESLFCPEDFLGVQARASVLEKEDPESHSQSMPDPIHGWTDAHERHQKAKERKIWSQAMCAAITEAANSANVNSGFVAYCSWPAKHLDDQEVIIVLQVQKDVHDEYYQLKKRFWEHRARVFRFRLERSLIDAVIDHYLDESRRVLGGIQHGSILGNIEDVDHLFLESAKSLMYAPGRAGGNDKDLAGLFDACNNLSTMKYEGKEGVGTVVFARRKHPQVSVDFSLTSPVPLRSPGAVRKLLQMASGKLSLLSDGSEVYALGSVLPTYDLSVEDVFAVRITKQFVWSLMHGDHTLMHVRYGVPSIRIQGFPEARFRRDLPRLFSEIGAEAIDRLTVLANRAAEGNHGCMLVISENAATEAERLDSQCTRVEPFLMTEELIPRVTSIDGSVLVDTDGTCHAIGVILDGLASPRCTPERGARYNSAIRYVYNRNDAMAVLRSEDGMISLFPELMPQINRRQIRDTLEGLRQASAAVEPDRELLWNLMSWLHKHEFYLTADECEEAERLHDQARAKIPKGEMYAVHSASLTPHSDMNASYYLPVPGE
jgi:hypothetical protein